MYREVSVIEIREVLRAWMSGAGTRTVAARAGVDRKTARRYVDAAVAAGLDRDCGVEQLTDELISAVVTAVRPDRPQGHGQAWEALCTNHDRINTWVEDGLTVVKIEDLLARHGVIVPQRTLHRYCAERTDYRGRRGGTVPVADGEPGVECQVDFARMGMLTDAVNGRRRVVHALIFTAVFSRHMFVWLTFAQTLEALIDGCEAAWRFFCGVFQVLVPDNMSAIVAHADSVNPRFTVGWLEYAQARGFLTDPARVAHPQDKGLASRCTSCCGLGGNSFSQRAALSGGEAGVVGDRWFVEPFVLVVCLVGVEDPGLGPALDGAAVHFEALGELGCGEQALGAEPVGVAGQMVLVADVNDDAGGERLVLAGAVSGGVERFGRLGVGVGVQEPVECRDGVGAGLAGLPRCRWYRDGEAAGLSAAQTHVPVDAIGLVQGDVVDKQTNHAFAVPLRGVRVGPEGGESVVSERICCFTWSVSSAASAVVTRS
jgi:hypothetical protein